MQTLIAVREQIDAIDKQIINLLNERVSLAYEVAEIKSRTGVSALTDARREEGIIQALIRQAKDPVLTDAIPDLYRRIFQMSKQIRKLKTIL
jgi:chorismate mutase/prephenate dehydratase